MRFTPSRKPHGGVLIRSHGRELHVWVLPSSPLRAAVLVAVVVGFLTGWIVGPASVGAILFVLLVAAAAGAGMFNYQGRCDRHRGPDLVFDSARGVLTRRFPPPPLAGASAGGISAMGAWAKATREGTHVPVVLPLATIRAIEVHPEMVTHHDAENNESRTVFGHIVARVADAGGSESECRLATMLDVDDATAFAAWVRATLGLA